MNSRILQRIKYSPLSKFAALPKRTNMGFAPLGAKALQVVRWLVMSREWANFSYDYEAEGLQAIICSLSALSGCSNAQLREYARELHEDAVFAERYHSQVRSTELRWTSDRQLHFGRCLVNYMLVRASGARFIFEAGTERGLSTWAMCRAVVRNGDSALNAQILTVVSQADRGGFLIGDEGGLVRRLVGDSVASLLEVTAPIDLFLHDTVNDPEHSRAQFAALATRMAPGALVHSCWFSTQFAEFCEQQGLVALEYAERPKQHWYAGRRCGLAVRAGKVS